MFNFTVHGVTKIFSIDVHNTSDVLKGGWATLQVATRTDTFNKYSPESHQTITLFFEDLEEGLDSFMEEMVTAYDKWKQDNTVLRRIDKEEPGQGFNAL